MGTNYRYLFISALVIASWLIGLFAPSVAEASPDKLVTQDIPDLAEAIDASSVLEGTVSSLGYCDANPAPLEGAEVTIETSDGITTTQTTTAEGFYHFEFDLELGVTTTVTATVSAINHTIGFAAGIILEAEETTVQDFDLRWLVPCTTVEPSSLEVSLEAGQTTTLPLHLSNTGAASTTYTVTEQTGGFTPFLEPTSELTREIVLGDGVWSHSDLPAGLTVTPPLARPDNELILTQSLSQSLIAGNSISCNSGGYHTENSYLRVFNLADFAINEDFAVSRVEIGIEKAVGAGGSQTAYLTLYTIENDLNWDTLALLSSVEIDVADTTLAILNIPIPTLVPTGSILVVEFLTPDGLSEGNSLFVGSNNEGQNGSTYMAAAACGVTDPTPTEDIGFPDMHLVMNVYGDISLADPGEVAWLKENPLSGTLNPGSSKDIEVLFTPAYTLTVGTYTSTLQIATDDPENNPLQIPVTMHIVDHDLELSATDDFLVGDPGSVVTYTLTLTNTSLGVTDSFDLSVLDDIFTTTLSSSTTPVLEPGESFTFQVEVSVGWLKDGYLSDTIKVLARFHTQPIYRDDIALTTRIRTNDLFLPIVLKSP